MFLKYEQFEVTPSLCRLWPFQWTLKLSQLDFERLNS